MTKVETFGFFQVHKMKIKLKEFTVKLKKLKPQEFAIVIKKEKMKKKKQKLECDLCGYRSISMFEIRNHIINAHKKTRQNKCEMCDWCSNYKKELNFHVKFDHVKCEICEKILKFVRFLRSHMKSHENPY